MRASSRLLARLFSPRADARAPVRPLWQRIVELARAKPWYREGGIADTLAGRFDAITLVLALVLIRMERDAALAAPAVLLTELFVEDMDGQLREAGIGDLVVGKHIGRLMGVLGGRLGALREALASADPGDLDDMIRRNVSLRDGAATEPAARMARALGEALAALDDEALLAGAMEIRSEWAAAALSPTLPPV